jgi:hypothetical protein
VTCASPTFTWRPSATWTASTNLKLKLSVLKLHRRCPLDPVSTYVPTVVSIVSTISLLVAMAGAAWRNSP